MSWLFRIRYPLWSKLHSAQSVLDGIQQFSTLSKCKSGCLSMPDTRLTSDRNKPWQCLQQRHIHEHEPDDNGENNAKNEYVETVRFYNPNVVDVIGHLTFVQNDTSTPVEMVKILNFYKALLYFNIRNLFKLRKFGNGPANAIMFVSNCLAENDTDSLQDIMPQDMLSSVTRGVQNLGNGLKMLSFTEKDVMFFRFTDLREYDGEGKSFVEIDSLCSVRIGNKGRELNRRFPFFSVKYTLIKEVSDGVAQDVTFKNLCYRFISIEK